MSLLHPEVLDKLEGMAAFVDLLKGQSFGELALIDDKPRGASILCKTDCYFAVLSKEGFKN